jgi:hypothetical protein
MRNVCIAPTYRSQKYRILSVALYGEFISPATLRLILHERWKRVATPTETFNEEILWNL